MITTEQGFDMLPYVSDIYEKLNLEKYILDTRKKNKGKDNKDELQIMGLGLSMGSYILKQSPKIKVEIFSIVAIIEGVTIEEAYKKGIFKALNIIKELFEDKEAMNFFKQAME